MFRPRCRWARRVGWSGAAKAASAEAWGKSETTLRMHIFTEFTVYLHLGTWYSVYEGGLILGLFFMYKSADLKSVD